MSDDYLHHLVLRQELHGQIVQNGYWFRTRPEVTASATPTTVGNFLLQRFRDDILPKIRLFANNQLKFQGVTVTCVSPKFASIVEEIFETSNGAQPDDSLPSYCAGLVSLRTGFGGRSRAGRSYYAGVSEGDSSNSRLDADAFNALHDIGVALMGGFGFGNPTSLSSYGIWSWTLANPPPDWTVLNVPFAFTDITQTVARPVLVTQRHRKIGVGD